MTRLLPSRLRANILVPLVEQTPDLPFVATRLSELRDQEVLNALMSKQELYAAIQDIPGVKSALNALLALKPQDLGLKTKFRPLLVNPKKADFTVINQRYIGPDGNARQPLTKYLPTTIFKAFTAMNADFQDYLATSYNPSLPKRPGLIILSGYRSPWYQAAVYIIDVAEKGLSNTHDQITLPGYSGHSNIKKCAVDMTHLGDASGGRANADGSPIGFEETIEFKWLLNNAPRFGFWLPYHPGNKHGIIFEPWHWQYVGSAKKAKSLMSKHKVNDQLA